MRPFDEKPYPLSATLSTAGTGSSSSRAKLLHTIWRTIQQPNLTSAHDQEFTESQNLFSLASDPTEPELKRQSPLCLRNREATRHTAGRHKMPVDPKSEPSTSARVIILITSARRSRDICTCFTIFGGLMISTGSDLVPSYFRLGRD